MKKQKIKYKSGFTLVELIVSIAIIAIISTMALVNFKGHDKKTKVDLAAYKLASDIRRVQSFALSMKEFGGTTPANEVPGRGWGMHFRKNDPNNIFYIVFADGNNVVTDNCKYDATGELYETINIVDGVKIDDIKINEAGNPATVYVVFEPPNPLMYICKNTSSCTTAQCSGNNDVEIILSSADGSYPRTVKVNKFGLIEVQ